MKTKVNSKSKLNISIKSVMSTLMIAGLAGATATANALGPVGYATPLQGDPNIFVKLSEKVVPSVVNISTSSKPKQMRRRGPRMEPHVEDFFNRFFGPHGYRYQHQRFQKDRPSIRNPESSFVGRGHYPRPQMGNRSIRRGQFHPGFHSLGTGVVIANEGNKALILTNHHVIERADDIKVQFDKSLSLPSVMAKVVGTDPEMDLALIEVKTEKPVKALPLGDSQKLRVGEFVMAVGNPFGQGHSVSHGIISAKERDTQMILGRYLQTDAPINPGNSGGPLVNLRGEVIGINNAILAQAQGIGFAIPSNEIKNVLPQLRDNGKVARGFLGITLAALTPQAAAMASDEAVQPGIPVVAGVIPDSPAEKAGIRANDVILSFNGKQISTPRDLQIEVTSTPVGDRAKVEVLRSGSKKKVEIKIEERKPEPRA